ncbi:hypothetical protein [Mycobacterium sp. NAZ190054]|uniref:hypothetical protein n=1 Tax=Mycobacterium sp. NAZ190054 TaxID=1747766 RepID=UPI00079A5363|nr:hypothetical protein [Mycobacterium sp. NAZ190054]KWX58019.1 hypothetical protein ASJ79_10280 [Mycobacterium sp. NAZ190054]
MGDVRTATNFLAEWYLPDLAETTVDDIVTRLDAAAAAVSGEGSRVRLMVTLSVPTDEVLYGVFDAESPDAVGAACLRAGVPHQRLSPHVVARIATV